MEEAQQTLDDLLSGERHRIWLGSGAVKKMRDRDMLLWLSNHIDEIRARTESVELGGVHPNSEHLKLALLKLRLIRDNRECLCQLYPTYMLFDPRVLEV